VRRRREVISSIAMVLAFLLVGVFHQPGISAAEKLTIGFSMPDLSESFWISMAYGVDKEAKVLGVQIVKVNAGGDANVNQQISQIQNLLQRKVGAIIVGATNGAAVSPIVDRAVAGGIPVVGLSSIPTTSKISSAVGADHYGMGRLQAQCLAKALGSRGNVGMMAGPAGQSWADERAKGFRETVASKFSGIKIVTESRLADNRNSALTTMEDWIQRFPTLNGVYSATDDIGAGVVDAIKAGGKMKAIKVSSSNLSPTAQQLLKNGDFVCVSIQQIVLQGQEAVKQAVKAARRQPATPRVSTPALLVTQENMATLDMSLVSAPAGYKP
jgi:TMAO reductase system protein TorT